MRISALAFWVSAILVQPVFAADCRDQTQSGLNDCAQVAFQKADRALNEVYKEITGRLSDDADTTKLLTQAQRAWISFRDAECAFAAASVNGGSIYPMIHSICLETQTRKRTSELRGFLNCEEGSLDCPVPLP